MSTPTLTEAEMVELAKFDILDQAGKLTGRHQRLSYKALKAGGSPLPRRSMTLGGRVVTNRHYKSLAAKHLGATSVALTEDVPLADLHGGETKTLLRAGSATSVGAFQSLDTSRTYEPARRPLELLDLVGLGSTTEGSVPYMRQTTYTSAAVEVAEATSTTTGTKPEATLPFEQVNSPVEEIASWVPVTTRALADVDEMRGIIDGQLLYDARRRLETQLLAGNGTSPNLRGLDNTTGVLTQPKGADSVPLALAKGIAQVVAAGYAPTAIALHPDDWVDGVTVLLTAGGSSLGDILEVPIVKTASVAAGTGYVGAWGQLVVWLRSRNVFVSRSHVRLPRTQPRRRARRDTRRCRCARTGRFLSGHGDLGHGVARTTRPPPRRMEATRRGARTPAEGRARRVEGHQPHRRARPHSGRLPQRADTPAMAPAHPGRTGLADRAANTTTGRHAHTRPVRVHPRGDLHVRLHDRTPLMTSRRTGGASESPAETGPVTPAIRISPSDRGEFSLSSPRWRRGS